MSFVGGEELYPLSDEAESNKNFSEEERRFLRVFSIFTIKDVVFKFRPVSICCGVCLAGFNGLNAACSAYFRSMSMSVPEWCIAFLVLARFFCSTALGGRSTYEHFTKMKRADIDANNPFAQKNETIYLYEYAKDAESLGLHTNTQGKLLDFLNYKLYKRDLRLINEITQNGFPQNIQELLSFAEKERPRFITAFVNTYPNYNYQPQCSRESLNTTVTHYTEKACYGLEIIRTFLALKTLLDEANISSLQSDNYSHLLLALKGSNALAFDLKGSFSDYRSDKTPQIQEAEFRPRRGMEYLSNLVKSAYSNQSNEKYTTFLLCLKNLKTQLLHFEKILNEQNPSQENPVKIDVNVAFSDFLKSYFPCSKEEGIHTQRTQLPTTEGIDPETAAELKTVRLWLLEIVRGKLTYEYEDPQQLLTINQNGTLNVRDAYLSTMLEQECARLHKKYPHRQINYFRSHLAADIKSEYVRELENHDIASQWGVDTHCQLSYKKRKRDSSPDANSLKYAGFWEKLGAHLGRILGKGSALIFMGQTAFAAKISLLKIFSLLGLFHPAGWILTGLIVLTMLVTFYSSDTFASGKIVTAFRSFFRHIDTGFRYLKEKADHRYILKSIYCALISTGLIFASNSLLLYSLLAFSCPYVLAIALTVFCSIGSYALIYRIVSKYFEKPELDRNHYGIGRSKPGVIFGYFFGTLFALLTVVIAVAGSYMGLTKINMPETATLVLTFGFSLLGNMYFYLQNTIDAFIEKGDGLAVYCTDKISSAWHLITRIFYSDPVSYTPVPPLSPSAAPSQTNLASIKRLNTSSTTTTHAPPSSTAGSSPSSIHSSPRSSTTESSSFYTRSSELPSASPASASQPSSPPPAISYDIEEESDSDVAILGEYNFS